MVGEHSATRRIPGQAYNPGRGHAAERLDGDVASASAPRVGVLGLQGDVLEHLDLLRSAGAHGVVVNREGDLDDLDGLVIPGGESTTIGKLLERFGLLNVLRERIAGGLPTLGTCAGAILLSNGALLADGTPATQHLLGLVDMTARRNAFGRQVASFEGPVAVAGMQDGPMHGVFIRAPWFEDVGGGVRVLASVQTPVGARVVVVQQDKVLACAFHPELSGDDRLHRRLVELIAEAGASRGGVAERGDTGVATV